MLYAKVINDAVVQFPYTFADLKRDYPNVSFPRDKTALTLSEWNVVEVIQQPDPSFDPATEKLVQGVPTGSGDNWTVIRGIAPLTADEQEEYEERQDREAIKSDTQVVTLLKARPAAINTYIENNVTNLAEAKEVLKIYGRALAVVAQSVLK